MQYFTVLQMVFTSKYCLNFIPDVVVNECGAKLVSGEFIYLIRSRRHHFEVIFDNV